MTLATVLIVDDDELDRYLLKRDLQRTGLEPTIFECTDGDDAIAFLEDFDANRRRHGEAFPPLCIFLDINMPRMTGFEFLDAFAELRRSRADLQPCAVLMFSSSEHPEERERALAHDFVADFVVKGSTDADGLRGRLLDAMAD